MVLEYFSDNYPQESLKLFAAEFFISEFPFVGNEKDRLRGSRGQTSLHLFSYSGMNPEASLSRYQGSFPDPFIYSFSPSVQMTSEKALSRPDLKAKWGNYRSQNQGAVKRE